MLRSLFAGISGLSNHQVMLDIVGNNISNVNTVGFKTQRVTFRELLAQTIRGASRPIPGSQGGTNPQQIGLGSSVQSVDSTFTQGNLQTTGKLTDLAIEGDGFFIVSDGKSTQYTRAGAFVFDGLGQLVAPGSGAVLQGVMANDDGTIDYGKAIENITIQDNLVAPATATDRITLSGNLDAESDAQGSILRAARYLAVAENSDLITSLYAGSNGHALGVQNDDITIAGNIGGLPVTGSFTVTTTSTVADLVAWLNTIHPDASFALNPTTGAIDVAAVGSDITELKLTIGGKTDFNNTFAFDIDIPAGTTGSTLDGLRGPAQGSDLLAALYDSEGTKLIMPISGFIQIDGDLGQVGISPYTFSYSLASTTIQDLVDNLQLAFQIANSDGVELDADGTIIMNGDPGLDSEVSGARLSIPNSTNTTFSSSFVTTTEQFARDPSQWKPTATVYDSLGRDFQVGFTFTKRTGTNLWDWNLEVPGTASVLQGGSGTVAFDDQGRLQSFNFADQSGALVVDPGNGAETMQIELNPGQFGGLDGLLQFSGGFTATARDFEGHGAGSLQTLSIDSQGVITGQFSNGINQAIAQIAVSEFNNPSGLTRAGNGLFSLSSNTGPETVTFVGVNASGTIAPGQLEMSNVDLASEFTQMIIAQRGFQANARIISVGDQMLNDLVTIGR